MAKPHIVLVHGAWHAGNTFDILMPYLTTAGYDATALDLPSSGTVPPLPSLEPEIDYVRGQTIPLLDQGKDVVFAMHSYGGFAGSAALRDLSKSHRSEKGLPGGVVALVYIAAWMGDEGASTSDDGPGNDGEAGVSSFKVEDGQVSILDPIKLLYHDVDPVLAAEHASRLKPQNLSVFYAPQPYAAWRYIPTTYLLCSDDRIVPYARQLRYVAAANQAGIAITTFTCNTGHSPFLSQPEFTSKVIRHAAGEDIQVQ